MYNNTAYKRKKKMIEISILILVIIYILIFMIDYIRYKNTKPPLITIAHRTVDFEDGTVDEYIGLGWTYREYKRRAIGEVEMSLIIKPMKRPPVKSTLPDALKNYEIPENKEYLDKIKGVLYFYRYSTLLGTYKCINTQTDCNKAISGEDEYKITERDQLTKLAARPKFGNFENRWTFIEDSKPQDKKANEKQYRRTIYLYDIKNNKIISEYRNVKYSIINEDGFADGFQSNFIVQNTDGKWGAIKPTVNGPATTINFEFDSLTYNANSNDYIVLKDGKWGLYNIQTKQISGSFDKPIIDVFDINGTRYYKLLNETEVGLEKRDYFEIATEEKENILNDNTLYTIYPAKDCFITMNKDLTISIYSIDGTKKIEDIKANFLNFDTENKTKNLSLTVKVSNTYVIIYVPDEINLPTKQKEYYYDPTDNWKLLSIDEVSIS